MNTAKIIYAFTTWILLWGFAGGTPDLFWSRLPITALLLWILAVVAFFAYPAEMRRYAFANRSLTEQRRDWLFNSTKIVPVVVVTDAQPAPPPVPTFADALKVKWLLTPLVAFLVIGIFAVHGAHAEHPSYWLKNVMASYAGHDLIRICLLTLFAMAYTFIVRGLLQKEWGTGNVVFLMSITLGFASQSLGVFLFAAVVGWIFAMVAEKINFITSWLGEAVGILLFFAVLGFAV